MFNPDTWPMLLIGFAAGMFFFMIVDTIVTNKRARDEAFAKHQAEQTEIWKSFINKVGGQNG